MRAELTDREVAPRYPIRGLFADCCASADEQSAKSMAQSARPKIFLLTSFLFSLTLARSQRERGNRGGDHLYAVRKFAVAVIVIGSKEQPILSRKVDYEA